VRLLADQNFPLASVLILRAEGHDVLAASETMARARDREILARAGTEQRLLVTFDRDFGALAFRQGLSAPAGIVPLRFVPVAPEEPAAVLADLLSDSRLTLPGNFTVIDRERVRQRSLPGEGEGG
jgi:predicted nuclease of predicted toxin-antitoxin system